MTRIERPASALPGQRESADVPARREPAQLVRPAAAAAAPDEPDRVIAIGAVRPQQRVRVTGSVTSAMPVALAGAPARAPASRYTVADGTGELDLIFLGRAAVAGLAPGQRVIAGGRAARRDDRIVIWNPWYQILP